MKYAALEELKTPRLLLRKLRREDLREYNRLASSEAVTRYMLWKPHADLSESAASIEKTLTRYETGKCYRWAISMKETDVLIGIIDLLGFDEERNTCSFAYMLTENCWGRGYGTEALMTVLEFAFRKLKVMAVEADHFAQNPVSGAVMGKAGMKCCGTVLGKYEKNGVTYDALQYRICREEWQN